MHCRRPLSSPGPASARPRFRAAAAALLLCAASGCAAGDETPEPEPEPFFAPDAPGPHPVGVVPVGFTAREGVPIEALFWYPAASPGPADYRYGDLVEGDATDSASADCDEPRPVLLFSHGNGGLSFQTWTVMEFLASHGWVVAAPGHTGNTIFDNDADRWLEIALRRPWDIADTYDRLVVESAAPGSPLAGCVDEAAGYAVMGHSFGGFTSYAVGGAGYDAELLAARCIDNPEPACEAVEDLAEANPEALIDHSDARAWAAVLWAPAWFDRFGEHLSRVTTPALVLGADRDISTPWQTVVEPSYRALMATPRALGQLTDAGHFSFTDFCTSIGADDGCSDDFRPSEDVLVTVRTASLAFLRHVQGDERAAEWLPPEIGITSWENEP